MIRSNAILIILLAVLLGSGSLFGQGTLERATTDLHYIELGPFSVGGILRFSYFDGDYNPDVEAENGEIEFDTLILSSGFHYKGFIGEADFRYRQGGVTFLRYGWLGYEFDHGGTIRAGIAEVPFGLGTYGASLNFLQGLETYVGLADDHDLGAVYTLEWNDFTIDVGYFYSSEPHFNGDSNTSARGSYDVVSLSGGIAENNFLAPAGNFNPSPYRERHQFNIRVNYNFDSPFGLADVGGSAQFGGLESVAEGIDDGEMWAVGAHFRQLIGDWLLMGQLIAYDYDNSNDDITLTQTFGTPPFTFTQVTPVGNSDMIGIGGFDFPYFAASSGSIFSGSISRTWFPRIFDFNYITAYWEYSHLAKDGSTNGNYFFGVPVDTDFEDSQQFAFGLLLAWERVLVFTDVLFGKGVPLIGNENSQYFSGLALNGPTDGNLTPLGTEFDDGWQVRFNVNLSIFF